MRATVKRVRWKTLSLRARLGVLVAAAVAVAVVLVSAISWSITRADLYDQFDARLQSYAQLAAKTSSPAEALATLTSTGNHGPDSGHGGGLTVQFLSATGEITGTAGAKPVIPVLPPDAPVAAGELDRTSDVRRIEGDRFRVWTAQRAGGGAVQVAQDSEDVEDTLARLGIWLLVVSVAGVLGATLVGRAIARSALRPVDDLTAAAENVARTQELSAAIDVAASGEIGRAVDRVQRDARGVEPFPGRAAAAGGGRRSRAAHAVDEPAQQHRAAHPRRGEPAAAVVGRGSLPVAGRSRHPGRRADRVDR